MSPAPRVTAGLAVAAVVAVAAGCGGARAAPPPTTVPLRPLTITQAVQLSSTLYEDYRLGGARVAVEVPYTAAVTVALSGTVDFRDHAGHLQVVTDEVGDAPTVQDVEFTDAAVFTGLGRDGPDGAPQWSSRAPDPAGHPLDRVIQLLVALASAQRDNPLLIQEGQARWAGARTDGATLVDVYRYSPTITYWVGRADGRLRRFIAVVDGVAGPVTVDLSGWGPQTDPPPSAVDVTPGASG